MNGTWVATSVVYPSLYTVASVFDFPFRAPLITGTAAIDTNFFNVTETESFYWTSTTHLDGAPLTRGNYAVYLSFGQAYRWMPDPPKNEYATETTTLSNRFYRVEVE